jgi:hypothetical protein
MTGMHFNPGPSGGVVNNNSNASAPGGIGLLMGNGTNNNIININMQNMRGSGSSGPPPSSTNYIQINTENRAAAAQFIRNSYASVSISYLMRFTLTKILLQFAVLFLSEKKDEGWNS